MYRNIVRSFNTVQPDLRIQNPDIFIRIRIRIRNFWLMGIWIQSGTGVLNNKWAQPPAWAPAERSVAPVVTTWLNRYLQVWIGQLSPIIFHPKFFFFLLALNGVRPLSFSTLWPKELPVSYRFKTYRYVWIEENPNFPVNRTGRYQYPTLL